MKKTPASHHLILRIFLLTSLLPVTLSSVRAGNLEPPGPPGSTMKTLEEMEPRAPIASLPFNITTPGSYYFTGDLSSSSGGISINANNVTIDLMGYTLNGATGDGIYMDGRINVEIKNGTIRGVSNIGIYERSSSGRGHRIINVRLIGNGNAGVILNSYGNLIKDCTAIENGSFGLYAFQGSTIDSNTAYGNLSYGIYGNVGSTVMNNTSYANGADGIRVFSGTAKNNSVYYSQNYGLFISNGFADGNTAVNNNQSGGSYTNLYCHDCTLGSNHAP